jgi:hypothetical protein
MDSCTIRRRVVVQRWPAVPTAPNTMAGNRQLQVGGFVDDDRVVAAQFQQRATHALRHALADQRPTLVDPVKLISGTRLSSTKVCASRGAGIVEQEEDVREAGLGQRLVADLHRAMADSGVFGEGFQMLMSPQIAATNAFQAHTATGKLNALMIPTSRSDATARTCGGRGVRSAWSAVQLARQADGELADVDHFLHFAVAFRLDLAHLQRDQRTQRVLVLAQRLGRTGGSASPRRGAGVVRQTLNAAWARSTIRS